MYVLFFLSSLLSIRELDRSMQKAQSFENVQCVTRQQICNMRAVYNHRNVVDLTARKIKSFRPLSGETFLRRH